MYITHYAYVSPKIQRQPAQSQSTFSSAMNKLADQEILNKQPAIIQQFKHIYNTLYADKNPILLILFLFLVGILATLVYINQSYRPWEAIENYNKDNANNNANKDNANEKIQYYNMYRHSYQFIIQSTLELADNKSWGTKAINIFFTVISPIVHVLQLITGTWTNLDLHVAVDSMTENIPGASIIVAAIRIALYISSIGSITLLMATAIMLVNNLLLNKVVLLLANKKTASNTGMITNISIVIYSMAMIYIFVGALLVMVRTTLIVGMGQRHWFPEDIKDGNTRTSWTQIKHDIMHFKFLTLPYELIIKFIKYQVFDYNINVITLKDEKDKKDKKDKKEVQILVQEERAWMSIAMRIVLIPLWLCLITLAVYYISVSIKHQLPSSTETSDSSYELQDQKIVGSAELKQALKYISLKNIQ
jgi:hypothetical protein